MDIEEKTAFEERQDSEFELLQSIYNNDITDLRKKDAWKVRSEMVPEMQSRLGMGVSLFAYVQP